MSDNAAIRRRAWARLIDYANKHDRAGVLRALRTLKRHRAKPAKREAWHPDASRVQGRDAGPFIQAGAKLLWHTTEGSTAEGAISAYKASGSWPHFTLEPKTGRLFQHLPINLAGRALEHPAGTVETNRANCIQVELVGRAAETHTWSEEEYARIAALARWIEANAKVPRFCNVRFTATPQQQASRLGESSWLRYAGHLGHCHVPSNAHWDPGKFLIDKVLA